MPMSSVKIKEDDRSSVEPSTVAGISAFLGKLWKMVEDPKTDHLIAWGKSGNSFVIKNQIDFAKTILPNYYKHNNIASFIRQLNMYGFHKIISTTSGALDSVDNDEIEFTHPNFVRGRPFLLEQIKRKMNNPKENIVKSESSSQVNESIKRVLVDIKHLKGKQENLSSQFVAVKQENEILWRELSLLRQKHAAQQNILNKLIRFLVSLAQPSNHNLIKRRLTPLMLKDSSSVIRKQEPIIQESDHVYTMKKRESRSPGPTIHEIHSDMMDDVIIDSPELDVSGDGSVMIENDYASSPGSDISSVEAMVSAAEPIPAALLRSDSKGKKRIQRVYITPEQHVSPHFLISQPRNHGSSEYLVPEQTNNPLLELVHETQGDDDNEYITVLTEDGTEILPDNIPARMIVNNLDNRQVLNRSENDRKKQPAPRRKSVPRKTKVAEPTIVKVSPQKTKQNTKKKISTVAGNMDKKNAASIQGDDFLFDINLQTEPLIEIHTPKSNAPATGSDELLPEYISVGGTSPTSELQVDIPITVGDVVSKMSPNTDATNSVNMAVSPNMLLSPHSPMSPLSPINRITPISPIHSVTPISPLNPVSPVSPRSPASPNKNIVSSSNIMNQGIHPDMVLSSGASGVGQPISPQKTQENVFVDRMNECIDNAQNMKIACTTDTNPPAHPKLYQENLSNQIENMQADLNSLKEIMQNEGLTLDVNTLLGLFNEDPMDYNLPASSSDSLYKSNEDKIMGNELITAPSAFDLSDIFPNDWSQPNTPGNSYDLDYCSLNTPLIERNQEDQPLHFAPPNKKIKS